METKLTNGPSACKIGETDTEEAPIPEEYHEKFDRFLHHGTDASGVGQE